MFFDRKTWPNNDMKYQANAHFTTENVSSYYKIINIISFCAFFSNWISDGGQVYSTRCRLSVKDSHSRQMTEQTHPIWSNVENMFVKTEGKSFITFILFKRSSLVDFEWEPNQHTNNSMFILKYYLHWKWTTPPSFIAEENEAEFKYDSVCCWK